MTKIKEQSFLKGYEDSFGKITYAKIASWKSFGAFNGIVTDLFPRDKIADIPSIAHKLLRKVANTFPKYTVQYADLDIDSQSSLPSLSISSYGLYDIMDYLDQETNFEPVIGICILDNTGANMFHGTAFVAWKDSDVYHYAYYDPLAYKKKRVRKTGSAYYADYAYAETVFQEKYFSSLDIRFHNLAEFCYHKNDEFHCPQYVIDGEYCFIYSLLFLFKWVHCGKPIEMEGFRHVVESCYIVDPGLLTRANTKESMIYRVVLMSFLLTMIVKYISMLGKRQAHSLLGSNASEKIDALYKYHEGFKDLFGIPLLLSAKYST